MNRTLALTLVAFVLTAGVVVWVFTSTPEKDPNQPLPPVKSEPRDPPLSRPVGVEPTSKGADGLAGSTGVQEKTGESAGEKGLEKGMDRQARPVVASPAPAEEPSNVPLDEAATKEMIAQLADPKLAMRNKIRALGVIARNKDVRMLPVVRTFTKDSNDDLRRNAFVALGQIGEAEDLALIQAGLADPNPNVQRAAKSAEEKLRARLPQAGK